MADQLLAGIPPVFASNGEVVAGGSVAFYETGTLTAVAIFADQAGTVALTNPVTLDAWGRAPQVFYTGSVAVKEVIRNADGVEISTIDPSPRFSVTASGADGITFSPIASNPATDVQEAIENISTSLAAFSDSPVAAVGGGTANAISLVTGKSLAAVPTGQKVDFFATLDNTGPMTVAIDGLPPVPILTVTSAATPAKYVRAGVRTSMYYDGTQWIADRQVQQFSNTNGTAWLFADLRMVCSFVRTASFATVAVGSGFQDNAQGTWSFPVPTGYAFAGTPVASHSTNGANTWGDIEAPTATSVRPLIFANSAISGTGVSYLRAEGKWA